MQEIIKDIFNESADLKRQAGENLSSVIEEIAKIIINSIRKGGKLVLFGNGGSAADAQHIQGELTHQLDISNRKAIPSIALNTNSSVLTAIGNDWGYDRVFERQVEAFVTEKDVVIAFTTSGNSINIIKGVEQAKKEGAVTIAFTGKGGGKIKDIADISFIVPSNNTQRIQEVHITAGHIICKLIEDELYGN
ncbi:MAG TPA: D-sedoheptulose 7-phosphate isomerase [Candidatus Eremiobacteraeota bacterium]|nr:MAG: Phosphoheptose isomerase [bacterium ADurb.Bin363]HPZ07142.1 D-sedoheptulose 7-phosphate isomerase [Candidatus Eremiobacteraeota bacterium]